MLDLPTGNFLPTSEFQPNVDYLMALPYALISITGPDAAKFLQGQVTCDMRELGESHSRLGAQCNIKGRMLLCFRAIQTSPERVLLRVNQGLIEKGLANLGKYIVFSKAKLADERANYHPVGVTGPAAANIIQQVFAVELTSNDDWTRSDENIIVRISDNRYECWLAAAGAEKTWNRLQELAQLASHHFWTLQDIRAGLGDITPETYELFTPQAINFQLVNGINFRKGCYTGQEIVARLHYRGTLKRHMFRFESELATTSLPLPGSPLKNCDGKTVGELVLAAFVKPGKAEILASVTDDERADLYLENNPQKLSLLELPYAIPTANEEN